MSEIQIETASVSELRSEIKDRFEKAAAIEQKHENPAEMPQEDLEQVQTLLTEVDQLESHLALKESKEERMQRIMKGVQRYQTPAGRRPQPNTGDGSRGKELSPGEQFIQSQQYLRLKQNGAFNSKLNRVEFAVQMEDGTSLIEWKALLRGGSATSGGAFVQNDLRPGYVELLQRELNVLDLIPRLQTDSDTVEYVQEDTFTNAAAMTAEASATTGTSGKKPESTLEYSSQTSSVRTLAHWIPVTNRMLADSPAIAGIVNGRLLIGLNLELEDQVLDGDGSGENFTGILNTSGINVQGLGSDNTLDAIFKARTLVRVNGKGRPNAVILHPNDWESIRLARENADTGTLGGYLMGPPSQVGAVTVWGIPVVESEGIDENTGLVGDFSMGASLFDREEAAVRVGTIDDQFVRNMQTILAELRAAFVVWRPAMFTSVTGI